MNESNDRCQHRDQALRYRAYGAKNRQYVMQCLTCGQQQRSVPKLDPMIRALTELPPDFDTELSSRYWEDRFATIKRRQEEEQATRRDQYRIYLDSPEWRRRRALRLALDNGLCQAKMIGCAKRATEVHHLSYRHCGNEPLFELASVCGNCHRAITEMDYPDRDLEGRYGRAS